jgi:hypothetical protein
MASVARREEKGSDVNVASHMLVDVLEGSMDAAVVVSNDSDLKMPVDVVRQHVPLGPHEPDQGLSLPARIERWLLRYGGGWPLVVPADYDRRLHDPPNANDRRWVVSRGPVGW